MTEGNLNEIVVTYTQSGPNSPTARKLSVYGAVHDSDIDVTYTIRPVNNQSSGILGKQIGMDMTGLLGPCSIMRLLRRRSARKI